MVDVATSIDAPIKLLAPRSSSGKDFALLGLGDIVIPGLLISLCLRFDMYRHAKSHPEEEVTSKSKFNRSYLLVGMISYIAGLGGCMWIMTYFGRAQPALLYLSPACSESEPHFPLCVHNTGDYNDESALTDLSLSPWPARLLAAQRRIPTPMVIYRFLRQRRREERRHYRTSRRGRSARKDRS